MRVGGARARLRAHFLSNIGRVMDSAELRPIAGNISEWARRVRELRTNEGFLILTHNDRADLKPGQYLLESAKPQPAFARGISKEARAFVLDRNGFTCQMCGAVAGEPITLQRPDLNKLLVQVRRATAADQWELLKWLKTKFRE